MSEAKFTSGPWGVIKNSAGAIEVVFSNGSPCRGDDYLSVYPTSSKNDCECISTGGTAEANAHLIAAAPEMYSILCDARLKLSFGDYESKLIAEDIKMILAKARGES